MAATKTKIYPNTFLSQALRDAGADVRLLWEIPGPKNTQVVWLSCYSVNHSLCIVSTFTAGNGWDCYTPCGINSVSEAVTDVLARCPK